jgi:gluconate kinase
MPVNAFETLVAHFLQEFFQSIRMSVDVSDNVVVHCANIQRIRREQVKLQSENIVVLKLNID